ncbi:uncharacterized protein [Antedon mediterranea]|uniref:uncharacterized protein n=1 Tax=Antedon mediterranea TaxID=105859 RepID=UPI003AF87605
MRTRMIAFSLFLLLSNGCYAFGLPFYQVDLNNDVKIHDICYPVWEILTSKTLTRCLLNYEDEKERNEIQKERNEIQKEIKEIVEKRKKPTCQSSVLCPKR